LGQRAIHGRVLKDILSFSKNPVAALGETSLRF